MSDDTRTALEYMIENRKAYDEALNIKSGLGVRAEAELAAMLEALAAAREYFAMSGAPRDTAGLCVHCLKKWFERHEKDCPYQIAKEEFSKQLAALPGVRTEAKP